MIRDGEGGVRDDGKSLGLCLLGQSFTKHSGAPVTYKVSAGHWKVTSRMRWRSFQSIGEDGTSATMAA